MAVACSPSPVPISHQAFLVELGRLRPGSSEGTHELGLPSALGTCAGTPVASLPFPRPWPACWKGTQAPELRAHSDTLSGALAVSSTSSPWSSGFCGSALPATTWQPQEG